MTIIESHGNLLTAKADALVNTVNTVGVMGRGIAHQFKQAFPDNFKAYARACNVGEVKPGRMFVFETGEFRPRFIINFPTKRHWKGKAKLDDIRAGLVALVEEIAARRIKSIAVPPLGCGNGGLDWRVVRPIIVAALADLANVDVMLYGPEGAPPAEEMLVGTERPRMTAGRANLLRACETYCVLDSRLTLLEVQKLGYFLQVAGEKLSLNFEQGKYGPYSKNLYKALQRMEGHFIRGVGDEHLPGQEITLDPTAVDEARKELAHESASAKRLGQVVALIEGFQTPYGMELLASVHWMATTTPGGDSNYAVVVPAIQRWNTRKAKLFSPHHIEVAWQRLHDQGWLKRRVAE